MLRLHELAKLCFDQLTPSERDRPLERFPTEWSHSVDKKSLKYNELKLKDSEHVLIEKVDQLFRNRL